MRWAVSAWNTPMELRASSTLLEPKPRSMLWMSMDRYELGSAIRITRSRRFILGLAKPLSARDERRSCRCQRRACGVHNGGEVLPERCLEHFPERASRQGFDEGKLAGNLEAAKPVAA